MTLVIPHTVRRQFIFDSAKMGVAVLIDHETCLNHLGLRCDVCYRVCPVIDKAITLELVRNTRTGRGRCIDVCSKDVFTFGSRSHSPALQPPGIY